MTSGNNRLIEGTRNLDVSKGFDLLFKEKLSNNNSNNSICFSIISASYAIPEFHNPAVLCPNDLRG